MASRITRDQIGFFLCGGQRTSGSPDTREGARRFLQEWYPGVRIGLASSPPDNPRILRAFIETYGLQALVVVADADPPSQAFLQESAEEGGLPPWAVHMVPLHATPPAPERMRRGIESIKALCAAALERVLTFEEIPLEHLKPCYPTLDTRLSRRALFRPLAGVRYEVVPQVHTSQCKHRLGCNLCLKACPLGAITSGREGAAIDKNRCDGCGICVKSCPAGATHYPTFDPHQIDQAMRGLLHPGIRRSPWIIALACKDVAVPFIPEVLPLSLPCAGMASPFMLLRAFELGADGVVVIQEGNRCGRRHEFAHLEREIRTCQAALEFFGIEKERSVLLATAGAPEVMLRILEAFRQRIHELGPTSLADTSPLEPEKHRWQLGPLVAGIARKVGTMAQRSCGLPLGRVEVDVAGCTLCGLCALPCPTEALRFASGAGEASLTFEHATCVACGLCLRACPERALTLRRGLHLDRLQSVAILLREEMACCRRCGAAFAPRRMCEKVQTLLTQRGTQRLDSVLTLCPTCRVTTLARPRFSSEPDPSWGARQHEPDRVLVATRPEGP